MQYQSNIADNLQSWLEQSVHDRGFVECVRVVAEQGAEIGVEKGLVRWAEDVLDLHADFERVLSNLSHPASGQGLDANATEADGSGAESLSADAGGLDPGECRVIHVGPRGELGQCFVDPIWVAMAEHGQKLEGTVSSKDRHILIVAPGVITLLSFGWDDKPTRVLSTPVFPF